MKTKTKHTQKQIQQYKNEIRQTSTQIKTINKKENKKSITKNKNKNNKQTTTNENKTKTKTKTQTQTKSNNNTTIERKT